MPELLIGCGNSRIKKLMLRGRSDWTDLVTLDMSADAKPDLVHDLNNLPLPFPDNTFSEIHAYEVMEHVGKQGDWRFFFDQWSDFWRILKSEGMFFGTSPAFASPWSWGDPGHTRIISAECLTFLSQKQYNDQVGKTPMTDYRPYYKADFEAFHLRTNEAKQFEYIMQAIKPARWRE